MSTEQPPTSQEKSYKRYLEKFNSFLKSLKTKITKQKATTNLQDSKTKEPLKLSNTSKLLLFLSLGFIFGAFTSSMILYFKIKKIEKEYQKTQTRLQVLSSRLSSYQNSQKNQNQTQNQNLQAQVLNVINNLPPSNAFASFYINKLQEEKAKMAKEEQKMVKKAPPQPPPLPPLKTLIGKAKQNNNIPPPISVAPPLPQVSMIICSNGCYAISPSGQVYTNGFVQGNHRLVVTQNQVYWEKISTSPKEK